MVSGLGWQMAAVDTGALSREGRGPVVQELGGRPGCARAGGGRSGCSFRVRCSETAHTRPDVTRRRSRPGVTSSSDTTLLFPNRWDRLWPCHTEPVQHVDCEVAPALDSGCKGQKLWPRGPPSSIGPVGRRQKGWPLGCLTPRTGHPPPGPHPHVSPCKHWGLACCQGAPGLESFSRGGVAAPGFGRPSQNRLGGHPVQSCHGQRRKLRPRRRVVTQQSRL